MYVRQRDPRPDIHNAAILIVDGDVRPSSAGVKIATFDGANIRHGPGGKVIINYHHPDICPDFNTDRILRVTA